MTTAIEIARRPSRTRRSRATSMTLVIAIMLAGAFLPAVPGGATVRLIAAVLRCHDL